MPEYTDPWTGCTAYCTPSEDFDSYPIGHFGSGVSARLSYRHPDEQIAFWQFQIEQRKMLPKTHDKWVEQRRQEEIASWETKIELLRSPSERVDIARKLLAHREGYMHKLTPRDRAVVEAENEQFRAWIAQWEEETSNA